MSPPKVGPEKPTTPYVQGVYTGSELELQGKTALICRREYGGWDVQVTDMTTGLGWGWWKFPVDDWEQL